MHLLYATSGYVRKCVPLACDSKKGFDIDPAIILASNEVHGKRTYNIIGFFARLLRRNWLKVGIHQIYSNLISREVFNIEKAME